MEATFFHNSITFPLMTVSGAVETEVTEEEGGVVTTATTEVKVAVTTNMKVKVIRETAAVTGLTETETVMGLTETEGVMGLTETETVMGLTETEVVEEIIETIETDITDTSHTDINVAIATNMPKFWQSSGLPQSGKNIWKMIFFSRSGKSQGILWMVREI